MSLPVHVPVMVEEVVEGLKIRRGGHFIDATVGLGGHAAAILERISPEGKLLGIDADPEAIEIAQAKLRNYGEEVILVNDNFANLIFTCSRYDFYPVDGILLDLGVSSLQLDTAQRGFSFQRDAPLDMRFNPMQRLTAADIVNRFSERELAEIIRRYGEERHSRQIARRIVQARPITTTLELAQVVAQVVGTKHSRIHPATRTFMALRIMVNNELENLEEALHQTSRILRIGGRLVVISYHSLEDRIVKEFMRCEANNRGRMPTFKLITRKVIKPSPLEIASNRRSRSARMRIAERHG